MISPLDLDKVVDKTGVELVCEIDEQWSYIDQNNHFLTVEKYSFCTLKPVAIWLTHGHLDHVGGTMLLAEKYGDLPVIGPHEGDAYWLDGLPLQSRQFSFPHHDAFRPIQWLQAGDTLTLGKETFDVLFAPGHTPGHVVLFNKQADLAFVGDVLFAGSIGRTDFPGGNHRQLMNSIKTQLWTLVR